MAARKNALEDCSAASLLLHAQNSASATETNAVTNFTNGLVGHWIRYAYIKVYFEPNFFVYGQNLRTYVGNIYQRIPIYLHISSSVNIFHLLAQSYTLLDKNNRHHAENN